MSDAQRIADWLANVKTGMIAHAATLTTLAYPQFLVDFLDRLTTSQGGELPVHIKRNDGTMYAVMDLRETLNRARSLPGFGLGQPDYLVNIPVSVAIRLGDELKDTGLHDSSVPLLEFVRHTRNGAAHGNQFNLQHGEPRRQAEMRSIAITPSLHGQRVFFDTLGPGDFLDMLDEVVAYLRALTQPPSSSTP
jgi:hypothetical protein